ncbi:MAG: hypothetical protein F4Y08_16005 [Caldilineaceae bacterium SB0662_bin_9]|uniref:Uncharacterized protein n=1 Tax=Caldilineaceae bacterium SB0662_bin_9 TaxID=2605258 RepID=A0A6B1DVE1_9CHLR|nr:hypothetical protein [Caldilineaceae bacterium SB0662_bin_9]
MRRTPLVERMPLTARTNINEIETVPPIFSVLMMMSFGDKITVLASRLTVPSLCVWFGSGKP